MYFSSISLAETINRWARGGNKSIRRKLLMMIFRKSHIQKQENSRRKLLMMSCRKKSHTIVGKFKEKTADDEL